MGDLLVRNVPKRTLDSLKARARQHRQSLQAEALETLERAALPMGDGLLAWLGDARAPGLSAAPGLRALREARDER